MNAPYEEKHGAVIEIGPSAPKSAAGSREAKFSIISAIAAIALNVGGFTVRGEGSTALTMIAIIAVVLMFAGHIAAITAMVKGAFSSNKNVIVLAGVGLFLNGGLLSIGLGGVSIPGITDSDTGSNSVVSQEGPLSSRSGRRMITKNWTGSGNVIELDDSNFDSVVGGSDMPVLVDFWAPWCGPCRQMSPVIKNIGDVYQGRAKVCKLNTDIGRRTADEFNIRVIPTLILFKDGRVRQTWTGVTSSQTISASIDNLLRE